MHASHIESPSSGGLIAKHLMFGWWSLFCFVVLGIALETMHGFKVGWYLEEAYSTRRLMWTLGHAHGSLLSLVHVAFAGTLFLRSDHLSRSWRAASICLTGGTILLPGGFFLGGIFVYDGDPGLGVWFVPVGAFLILFAVFQTARITFRTNRGDEPAPADDPVPADDQNDS